MDALFDREGDRFVPTAVSVGPWSPNALHGGPVAALLARAVEQLDGGSAMHVARLTTEILRPIPRVPLELVTRLVRPGKKVQLVEATLRADEKDLARVTGLRIRSADVALPDDLPAGPEPLPGPNAGRPESTSTKKFHDGFHNLGVEHRFLEGSFHVAGPAKDWIRLTVPLLSDETPSPLVRLVAVADFGNGISAVLRRTHTYINPDLTIYLHRYPVGEWVCLDAVSRMEGHGVGFAESALHDERGPIGRALQALLIEKRD